MGEREFIIEKLREFKKELSGEIKVDKIIFFGSRARGDFRKESDVDLIIVSKDFKNKNFLKRAVGMYKHWSLDYPIDFLCYSTDEFKILEKRISIVSHALKEGVVI